MLIKDEIKKMLLLQLDKTEESVSIFTIYWNDKTDKFHGSIFFYDISNYFEYIVDLENHHFHLVSIKEIEYNVSEKIVYSIDGVK